MKYTIRISAIAGDIIPLGLVADAMAFRDATAGGPDYLRETRDGRYATYSAMLLKNVRNNALAVCGDDGDLVKPDDIVASRIAEGSGVVLLPGRLNDEPGNVNVNATWWLCNVFVKLKALNDWATQRGDEFDLSHDGVAWTEAAYDDQRRTVIDWRRRGGGTAVAGAAVLAADEAPPLEHWKMRVQAEAAAEWNRVRAMNCNPTRVSIRPHLLKWCRQNVIKTASNINPSDGYLRTHVLSGKHWTPPTD